ncbi:MAG: TolC family protein [Sideroxyarcus sp.]|nr:TolC family protein [Sideroxyarcus sp.]
MTPNWQKSLLCTLLGAALTGAVQASTLTDLLRQTLGNPGIVGRGLQLEAAARDASAADMRYAGRASVFAGHNHYDAERVVGVFTPGVTASPAPVAQDITQYGVSYHLPLDVFGLISAERELAKSNQAVAQLLARQETLLRLHQTLTAYVRLQALAAQSQVLQTGQKQLEAYANRVREEIKLGRTPRIDLSLVQSDLARLASQQAIFAGNRRAALAALKASANVSDALPDTTLLVPVIQGMDTQTSLPVALAREQQKSAAAAAQKVRRNLFPAFSVDGQYANYSGAGAQSQAWAVGLNMNMPLDPAGMRSASAAAQRAQAAQDMARAVEADTLAQIAGLEANYQAAVGNANALANEVEHRREVVAVEREKWRLGASTMDALLFHERNLLEAQFSLTDASAQAAAAWSGMQILLGTPSAQYIDSLEIKP